MNNNAMPTEPNAVTVHTIFKSTMAGDDGAEILYCLPASCKIILVKFLWHPFTFQAATITSLQAECNDHLTGKPRGGCQGSHGTIRPVIHNRVTPMLQGLHTGRFQSLGH